MTARNLAAFAAEQCGLFTRAQARRCGYSEYQVRRRIRTGEWQQVLPSVLAPAGTLVTPGVRDRAALLAVPHGVLAGPSAARRHGMAVRDPRTFLAVGPAYHARIPQVRLIRDALADPDVQVIDGVPLTGQERTVVDCLRLLPERDAVEFLD
ncbi:MAG: type IV toxin-antitoxin system AbiEi family antitoxin domain-containing protein, partial [Dactylosporangium sp.]|nr:type IV toxin-antitoxin system AbiEi family antitoxin domain-containing protein [Dactylosporangium sp.]